MSYYLTSNDYDRFLALPISLPETELRFQRKLTVCTFVVAPGQRLEMQCLFLQLFRVLTFGVVPQQADGTLGLVSVGLLSSTMFTSALGRVTLQGVGVRGWNSHQPVIITTPGTYSVQVYNNTLNVDFSVVVTGSARIIS